MIIEELLRQASEECENANHYNLVGLAERLYAKIKTHVPAEDRMVVAIKIAKEVVSCMN